MAKVIVLPVAARAADELSDEALLAACSTGDRVALGTLFDRHVDAMTRFVRRLGHVDEQDVDDLVHDTFLEVIRVAGTFRGGSSVRTWLFGIASNVARGRLRAAVRLRSARTRVGAEPPIVAEAVDDALARRQQIERLPVAIRELPHDLKVAFVLADLEDLAGVDVARAPGIPTGTLYRRLHEARSALRRALDAGGDS